MLIEIYGFVAFLRYNECMVQACWKCPFLYILWAAYVLILLTRLVGDKKHTLF